MGRRLTACAAATGLVLVLSGHAGPATASAAGSAAVEYTVVAEDGVTATAAIAAITAAGGAVVSRNDAVGLFRATSADAGFAAKATAAAALISASPRTPVGFAPKRTEVTETQRANLAAATRAARPAKPRLDPLDDKLWGLSMIRADQARAKEPGERGVTVGVLDTGLDATNPDLAPNFSAALSRNFAPDIAAIDGPCEVASCLDPVGTDDGGHGTHVAGTIAAAANGSGLSGVAPNVTLVELKSGQDSGYFFLDSVVNALVYAGDAGLDVVNMSFYVDPWLYNCLGNPADSPEAQAQQRATIRAINRALNYAHRRGVTLVGALGNNHEDLGKPRTDTSSPNYGGSPYPRPIDNATCFDLPVEGAHVIGVSAVGPSGEKADYSNYGVEQISVAAPGGWFRDGLGTPTYRTNGNLILSAYPKKVLQEDGEVDAAGNVVPGNEGLVFKDCPPAGVCGYYRYLQGTSMAAPHASGVAALIVSRFGTADRARGGLTMAPDKVEWQLTSSATSRACPTPRLKSYQNVGQPPEYDALCEGDVDDNGFYGAGIVDALRAVGKRRF